MLHENELSRRDNAPFPPTDWALPPSLHGAIAYDMREPRGMIEVPVRDRGAARIGARLRAVCMALFTLAATAFFGTATDFWYPFAIVCMLLALSAPWFFMAGTPKEPKSRKWNTGEDTDAKITEILLSGRTDYRNTSTPPNVAKIKAGPKRHI